MLVDKRIVDEKYLKTSALIGVITFFSFRAVDYFIFDKSEILIKIRFLYIGPFVLLLLGTILFSKRVETKVLAYSLLILIGTINVLWFMIVLNEYSQLYYSGLIFLVLFATNISGLPFKVNAINIGLIFIGFTTTLILYPIQDRIVFFNDVFGLFFVSAVGLFSNYQMDKYKLLNYQVKIKQNKKINKLAKISMHDGLTGLKNRFGFDKNFEREWNNALRNKLHLSVLMVDIDDFKKYNDNYGHLKGDEALKKIASVLTKVVKRTNDAVARFGGEEFIILLHNADKEGAVKVAKRILKEIEKEKIIHEYSETGFLTVSIGICSTVPRFDYNPRKMIETADKALYTAKRKGKNRYEVYA